MLHNVGVFAFPWEISVLRGDCGFVAELNARICQIVFLTKHISHYLIKYSETLS